MCPSNPELIAFVGSGDIWVMNSATGEEKRLTKCRKGFECLSKDPLTAGLPSYVTQEEFNRYTGLWWRPVSEGKRSSLGIILPIFLPFPQLTRRFILLTGGQHCILYEEVDESDVELVRFPQTCSSINGSAGTTGVEEFRFPKAGAPNAKSSLKLIKFTIGEREEICNVELLELKQYLESYFPWMEYLVRAGWTPGGK